MEKLIKVRTPYVMMSADFSQQEPKLMTQLCGDRRMLQAYMEGKDLYAEIAALSFHTTYEECLEFFPVGTPIKKVDGHWEKCTKEESDKLADGSETYAEGKKRRTQAKSILLGILYGRQEESIAQQLGCTEAEAKAIKESVFIGFPAIRQFEQDSLNMAKTKGYVTTLWGRKRRLPDINLPEFSFSWVNPPENGATVPLSKVEYYTKKIHNSKSWQYSSIIKEAKEKDNIIIRSNREKIADATRQTVNARIQGSAADMTKKALIAVYNSERLQELGARILVPVHDEIIIECPEENAHEVKELFAKLMSESATDKLTIPIKCDVTVSRCWYGEEIVV